MNVQRAYGLVVAVLLAVLLIFLQRADPPAGSHGAALQGLDELTDAEAALHRDAIAVRAGLLRDYDPLVADADALEAAGARVQRSTVGWRESDAARQSLQRSVSAQVGLVEDIKTDSALLQNSLAYFSRMSAPPSAARAAPADLGALAATVLRLTLDTSEESQQAVDRALAAAVRATAAQPTEERTVLLAHARLLRQGLPSADRTLTALLSDDAEWAASQLRAEALRRQAAAETGASRARIGVAATAFVLVILILHAAQRLSHHIDVLARRGRRERLAAGISASLIGAWSTEVDAAVTAALDCIARDTKARRAYLLVEGGGRTQWPSSGAGLADGWPERALRLAGMVQPKQAGEVLLQNRMPTPSGLRRELTAAGLSSVALVWATSEEGERIMLGLDTGQGRLNLVESELGVLRLVLDATAGAIRRSRLIRARIALERRLQAASRMEALGSFASGIAHNFNNVLAAIGGYAEMAAVSVAEPGPAERHIGEISQAVTRGRDLIDRILAFGGRRGAHRSTIDLAAVVREAAALLAAAYGDKVQVSVDVAEAPDQIVSDPVDLQQVILNLGANAVRAMDGVGRVDIAVDRKFVERARACTVGELARGDYARIVVRDTGCGMEPKVFNRIFEPFFTTTQGGHGLGLATVGEIVRDHGGGVEVESAPGEGTIFEVWLPGDARTSRDVGPGAAVLVLCARTDEVMAAEETLAALSFEPDGHHQLDAALEILRQDPDRFGAAVVSHPAASEVVAWARALREIAPRLPLVVATSSFAEPGGPLTTLPDCALIPWPLKRHALARALQRGLPVAS